MRSTKLLFLFLLHFVGCKEDRNLTTERGPVAYKKNCDEPLGLENGDVEDSQILLSTPIIEGNNKRNPRLNSETSWVTDSSGSQYIQVSFLYFVSIFSFFLFLDYIFMFRNLNLKH